MDQNPTLHTPMGDVQVRRAAPHEVIDLRHAVLRAGLPRETAVFPGDECADARHVVAVAPDGRVIGCATALPSIWDGATAWQVRGMATDPAFRSMGVGGAMLACLEDMLRDETAIHLAWCNARLPTVGFYQKHGWHVASEVFEIPTAGPHVRMTKKLTQARREENL
jgi:GNAT superfamily N-acetyltransferase